MEKIDKSVLNYIFKNRPQAVAQIFGGSKFPNIFGIVEFYALPSGVLVLSEISNLPLTDSNIFAFHIHEKGSCDADFSKTGGHYNPTMQPHPKHSGDMPPLFAFSGEAFSFFFTKRFSLDEIVGKTVIIHQMPDDFTSQSAGNSGQKIACGVIRKV